MKSGIVSIVAGLVYLAGISVGIAQSMDPQTVWPLCGRIMENKPKKWNPSKGCPTERFGNPTYTDAPFSSTFGPRPLGSENDRYDFHRGVDIATPTGTPIFAVTEGNVEIAGDHSGYSDPLIKLRHFRPGFATCTGGGGCYHSYYLHISDWVVGVDEWVEKGQLIGYTGASGASGFQHLHFEVRDAPAFDAFSAWQRDSVHPFGTLPYDVPNSTSVVFNSVDNSNPGAVIADVTVTSNRYDLVSVEMSVLDSNNDPVIQPGNTPNADGYHVLPSFYDMETWNFEYSHKDSSNFPWESFGVGGAQECPYHAEHGVSYSANVHMDAQHPADYHEGLFNGIHVTTGKYWLTGNRDYQVRLEFLELLGPAACIQASAVFSSGDVTTGQWGSCGTTPNNPPTAAFVHQCTTLDCVFDGSGSSDTDGLVDSYAWSFGDGSSGSGVSPAHSYAFSGDYLVSLTVTDDAGATGVVQHIVSVQGPMGSDITASLATNRKRNRVSVHWTGAVGVDVDIFRNGLLAVTTTNDGRWNDRSVNSGNSYSYLVCEAGSISECSSEVVIDL